MFECDVCTLVAIECRVCYKPTTHQSPKSNTGSTNSLISYETSPMRNSICILIVALYRVTTLIRHCHAFPIPSSQRTFQVLSRINANSEIYQSTEKENNNDDNLQYYSPNVELDNNRYRYDLEPNEANDEDAVPEETLASSPSTNEYSFFDEAIIYTRAGSGGQGSSTYQKGPRGQNAQPDGGDGGKGGNVILVVEPSLNTLAGLTRAWRPNSFGGGGGAALLNPSGNIRPLSFRGENGQDGARQFKSGRFGKDVTIRVPKGTMVQEEVDVFGWDDEAGEEVLIGTDLIDLGTVDIEEGQETLLVATGGEGGEGSGSQGYKKGRGVKRSRAPPVGGERKRLKLTLKIVADVALVGVPNAGKSTFLAAVTRAKPKIANYPFTTVIPNLGVWIPSNEYDDADGAKLSGAGSEGLALCDVPGLIAGAAEGVGLGHAFLRHVERCHVILHLVDATSNDPVNDFQMVNREIMRYGNGKLAQMPQIVVVNKVDAWEMESGEEWEKGLKTRMDRDALASELKKAMPHSRLMWMSAKEKDGVDDLMSRMAVFVKKVKDNPTS